MYLYERDQGDEELVRRISQVLCSGGLSCSPSWETWGRWAFVGGLIVCVLLMALTMRRASANRVQRGDPAIVGTAWMVPPSYNRSQRQQFPEGPPVPTYNPELGHDDLGYYDREGNFIQKAIADRNSTGDLNYEPLEGPPPAHFASPREDLELEPYENVCPPASPPADAPPPADGSRAAAITANDLPRPAASVTAYDLGAPSHLHPSGPLPHAAI